MGWTCFLAGQDITAYTDELTVQINDTLAQGAGVMGGSTSRAATCTIYTRLGPIGTAPGAGQTWSGIKLVRGGEIKIYDGSGTQVFGGYIGKLTDQTTRTFVQTQIDAYDYYQHLDRIYVNESYANQTDIYIIANLLAKYAPWVNRVNLTGPGNYTFLAKNIRNMSLQRAIASITDVTGFALWIGYDKVAHYNPVTSAPACSFNLSTSPDFVNTFDVEVTKFEQDDTGAINRVFFYGGHNLSGDYVQDLSSQVDGKRTDFELLYYPHPAIDGKYHVRFNNGKDLTLGFVSGNSTTKANTLKPKGTADCLLDTSQHVLTFAYPPTKGTVVTIRYRHEYPLLIKYTDKASYHFFGQWYDGALSDETVIDPAQAIQRCKVITGENSMGLTTIECVTRKAGAKAGQMINLYHSVRGINSTYLIQQVQPMPLGGGQWKYKLTLGAWSWKLVDLVKHHAVQLMVVDQSSDTVNATNASEANHNSQHNMTTNTKRGASGQYYARTVAQNDGHDGFAGYSTINS